ncbi:hypothetical protein L7F22_013538 [Adiantum nelumboides]|nr:hypothetical protein [Adiantum nelumboides]
MVLGLSHLRKKKSHGRRRCARFIYRVQLLEIKPWFSSQQALASNQPIGADSFILRWHRGSHRAGLAQSNIAFDAKPDGTIPFHHAFELPVTLYCSSSSATFEEKLIGFTLLDAEHSVGPPIARGSFNLAAYGASGMDISGPTTSTVRVPLILCRQVTSKVVIPNLHILITPSVCKRTCFGEGEFQSKAQSVLQYLPTQTVHLLRKREVAPPLLDNSSRQALVAALLEEEGEHQEEEEEAELEPFTDDESSSGLHTPHGESSFVAHPETNIMAVEDKIVAKDSISPPLSSRKSVAQVAWTPTPRRQGLDEATASLRAPSDFYNSSKEDFITLSQDSSGTLSAPCSASTVKETQHEHIKPHGDYYQGLDSDDKAHTNDPSLSLQTVAHKQQDVNVRAGHLAEKRGLSTGNYHDQCDFKPADLKMQRHPQGDTNNDNFQHVIEAEALRQRIISQLHENRLLKFDFDAGLMADDDDFPVEEDINVLEEARRKFAEGADKRNAEVTKRLLEETKMKLIDVETKLFSASEKVSFLQLCIGALEGELQDVATIEMFVFSTVAEHGEAPNSVLVCACHLTKLLINTVTNWSHHRWASLMRSTVSGLLLASRACGQDVARLTFWWSNVLALRYALVSSCSNNLAVSTGPEYAGALEASEDCTPANPEMFVLEDNSAVHKLGHVDWSDGASFITALEEVEATIYIKVVEAVWWQTGLKNCPVLSGGKICSCVSGLPRVVIEECVARLDVLMFNAILPISESELSRKPMSAVLFEGDLLPISPRHMTFGAGMQLKNVVGTWSTWLTILLEKLTNSSGMSANDESRRFISFPLLKALADLLMLPRDMVATSLYVKRLACDVCPVLTLPVIRRIMSMVEPDDFAPDAVSPSLLAALNAEQIEMEKRMLGDVDRKGFSADGLALEPTVTYRPHSATFKDLTESTLMSIISKWAAQDGNVLHDLKTKSGDLVQNLHEVMLGTLIRTNPDEFQDAEKHKTFGVPLHRYKLVEELWIPESTSKAPSNVVSED